MIPDDYHYLGNNKINIKSNGNLILLPQAKKKQSQTASRTMDVTNLIASVERT
jgi:hypothetical protein